MYRSKVTVYTTLLFLAFTCTSPAKPVESIPFTKKAIEEDLFVSIPVTNYAQPQTEIGLFPYGENLQEGYLVSLNPGEATLLASKKPVQTNDKPTVITLNYSILDDTQSRPQVAVIGLNTKRDIPDGQLGYFYHSQHSDNQQIQQVHLIYQPPSGAFLPAVQVSLPPDAEEPVKVVLLSLSIYSFDPAHQEEITQYGFDTPLDPFITNVNADTGVVQQNRGNQTLVLSTKGNTEAANVQLDVSNNMEKGTILLPSADVSRLSGEDGMTTLLLEHAGQNLGLFVSNKDIPMAPQTARLWIGGYFQSFSAPTNLYIQNGGGQDPSQIQVDNAIVTSYPIDSISGLETPGSSELSKSLAVAVILPKNLFSGSQGSLSLTAFDSDRHESVNLPYRVTIRKEDEEFLLAKGTTGKHGFSSQTFTLPSLPSGTWKMQMTSGQKSVLEGTVEVKNSGVLIIQTDKPIYKPGQKIQGRVLYLNNALQPLDGDIELYIADAKGIRIHRELLKLNEYGVASFELPLANELNMGTWKITAFSGSENKTDLDIEVDRYVLPPFEVNLDPTKDWFLVNERITGTIDSHYFFGKPVQGKVHISALRYVSTWEEYATQDGVLENGLFSFDLPPVEYIAGTPGEEGAGTLQIKVTVTDETGVEESTDALAKIVDAGVTIKLIPESPVMKPGLNQDMIIITETPGNAPLSLPVTIEISFADENGKELDLLKTTIQTENGIGTLQYDVPSKSQIAVVRAAAEKDGQRQEETLLQYAAYSPGSNYIHLRQRNSGTVKVGEEVVFDLLATNPGTLFFDVYAGGRTLFSKAVEGNEIRFTVTPDMSPSAKIVAYMIQPNNEISVDVLPFDVVFSPTSSLTAEFSAEEVKPGAPVSLSISHDGKAMIGLSIVDESVFALVKGRLNLKNVMNELERIFMKPQIEVHDNPDFPWRTDILTSGKGADDILQENNLQIFTTGKITVPKAKELDPWVLWGNPQIRKNFPIPVPFLEAVDDTAAGAGGSQFQEPDRIRTFFPETWVWQPELLTDENGSATLDLTAPDSITTWKLQAVSTSEKGMGITDSSLRVFQDFFAEPDLPYAVIRGDEFPLRVRIFNYIDDEQRIRITLENPDELGLQGEAVQEIDIPGQSAASVSFTLKPEKVGIFPVSLIAQSSQRADAIRKDLRVEPEGIRQEIVHNGILKDDGEAVVELSFPEPIVRDLLPETPPRPIPPIEPPMIEIVPDSETVRVAITPSLVGQSLDGLDDLLGMPYGCGEQNMIFLAPDIEVLRYLQASGQLNPEVRAKAEHFITTGYQRELTFQRDDGSFSAFGQQDDEGSLWLTAFVLSTFSKARDVRYIDPTTLSKASNWIINHQNRDGAWEPVGFVIHKELTGGLNGNLALTAYITNALLDYNEASETELRKAISYLEKNSTKEDIDSLVLAQVAYALLRAESSQADAALDLLLAKAVTDDNGLHWEPHAIEATGYAAMALLARNRIEAQSALQWIAAQRNSLGGYGSTQDTVIAFQALTTAAAIQSRDLDATIDVLVNNEVIHTFQVNSGNFDVLQSLELKPADQITFKMKGQGTVMYQVVHGFNVPAYAEPVGQDMLLKVSYSSEHVTVDDIVDVNVSINYMGIQKETGMAIADVSIPTGFGVIQESLDKVNDMKVIKRIEQAGRKVIFYIDKLISGEPLEFTFQVKALFPVKVDSGTNAAYLYYDTDTRAETGGIPLSVD